MTEQNWILQVVMTLISSGVISGVVAYFVRRDTNRVKVRMAELEVKRVENQGETATTTGILTIATSAIGMLQNALEPLRQTLEESATSNTKAAATIETLLQRAEDMHTTVAERDRQIEALPGKVAEEMAQDLEKIPRAVEEALAPKIEALRTDINALFQSLDDKLTDRIEAATDKIPNRTTELVRSELAALKAAIETGFREVLETAKSVQIPDDEPGEGIPVAPDIPSEMSKEG